VKTIDMQPVESSQIAAVGFDSAENILAVQFKNGGLYHYHEVPPEKFAALVQSESVGKFHAQHIKGAHRFEKVETPELAD